MLELARRPHLIGKSEAVDPSFLRRAPLAAPHEGPLADDAVGVRLHRPSEVGASREAVDANAFEPQPRLDIEQLRQDAEHLDRRGEAGRLDQWRLAMRAILPHRRFEFVGRA